MEKMEKVKGRERRKTHKSKKKSKVTIWTRYVAKYTITLISYKYNTKYSHQIT
jgi:hypothetical protein